MTLRPWRSAATTASSPAATGPGGWPGLTVPPAPMPMRRGSRPLKRWCYAGLFGPELMICAAAVKVGPLPESFWAVWDRRAGVFDTQTLLVRSARVRVGVNRVSAESGGVRLELALTTHGRPVEVISPHGRSYIWTRKTPVRAMGHIAVGMEAHPVSLDGLLDETAGYHARRTAWEWSAGVGVSVDGAAVTWNLVRGVNDAATMSERTVWVEGRPEEVPAVQFSADLDEVWGADGTRLHFEQEAVRSRSENLGLLRSDYVQPFGRFAGTLPGGVELSRHEPALGVMERHRALW